MFFASDELYTVVPLQTGWYWLLTPVKNSMVASYPYPNLTHPWYFIPLYLDHYLDLRVTFLDLSILIATMIIIPMWLRSRQGSRRLSLVSAFAGLVFGLGIATWGIVAHGAIAVCVLTGIVTVALFIFSFAAIKKRIP